VLVFRERYAFGQWLGLALVGVGLWLFFRDQWSLQAGGAAYLRGSLVIVLGAVVWAIYALAQKQLLNRLTSPAVLLFVYVVASLALLPLASPGRLAALDAVHWAALLYCALNTLVAYGAFAEALAHWEASRVSVVLALTPILTVACVEVLHALAPGVVAPEQIGAVGFVGAFLVVAGSALSSLLGNRRSVTDGGSRPARREASGASRPTPPS
jgi:drug/metabolite transporter (DMT)-like permease